MSSFFLKSTSRYCFFWFLCGFLFMLLCIGIILSELSSYFPLLLSGAVYIGHSLIYVIISYVISWFLFFRGRERKLIYPVFFMITWYFASDIGIIFYILYSIDGSWTQSLESIFFVLSFFMFSVFFVVFKKYTYTFLAQK